MRSLWTRIGVGALGIFAVGMLLLTLAHNARDSARNALLSWVGAEEASASPAPEAPEAPVAPAVEVAAASSHLASMSARFASLHAGQARAGHDFAFRLDGDRIGSIQHLSIRRARRGTLPDVTLLVILKDRDDASRLEDCDLMPVSGDDVAGDKGFTCADDEMTGLTTIGSARIEPVGITRPIRVTERATAEMRDGDPFEVNADAGGQVRVTARGDQGQGVRVLADSSGASIKIDDALGRAIFRLLADSTGASMRIRGKDGRDVVRMEAANGSFSLTVDTTAAH
jgi:hypothetical protein